MIPFDAQKVLLNARAATTEDLLDRVTVQREGMDPEAIALFEDELRRRGVGREQVEQAAQRPVLRDLDGLAVTCSFCRRPAVARGWGWHWLWGRLPLFPRRFNYCEEHRLAASLGRARGPRSPEARG